MNPLQTPFPKKLAGVGLKWMQGQSEQKTISLTTTSLGAALSNANLAPIDAQAPICALYIQILPFPGAHGQSLGPKKHKAPIKTRLWLLVVFGLLTSTSMVAKSVYRIAYVLIILIFSYIENITYGSRDIYGCKNSKEIPHISQTKCSIKHIILMGGAQKIYQFWWPRKRRKERP